MITTQTAELSPMIESTTPTGSKPRGSPFDSGISSSAAMIAMIAMGTLRRKTEPQ